MKARRLARGKVARTAAFLSLLVLALSLLSCASTPEGGSPPGSGNGQPPPEPDIKGRITKVAVPESPPWADSEAMTGKILVEAEPGEDTRYERAWVTVLPETRICRASDGGDAHFTDLRKGTKVEVFFSGPVRESYPVEATASRVAILE